jgi:hypothetical protein
MSHTTYYVQECPTCGRRLQIRVAYLGRRLFCQHCGGPFYACDPSAGPAPMPIGRTPAQLLERAEELLAFAEQQKPVPGMEGEFLGDAASVG